MFINNVTEYNQDTWNDLKKYIKRKATTKLDDKIKKIRKQSNNQVCDTVTFANFAIVIIIMYKNLMLYRIFTIKSNLLLNKY